MAKASFNKDIKEIAKKIESDVDFTITEGLQDMTKAAFGQVANKYLVKGNYSINQSGKVVYTTPPGANINSKRVVFRNKKTGYTKYEEKPMFVKGKIVSRTGTYQKQLDDLAKVEFKKGKTDVGEVKVEISKTGVKVYAKGETLANEIHKQQDKTPVMPITKAFRSVANLWKNVKKKLAPK